jgi:hypothetical protein
MPLPKTKYPLFEATLPSTKKKIMYRQMLVSDEKILLMAKSGEDEADINRAVKQVVNNCVTDSIEKFTTFDIEYLFVKIRAVSIGNVIEVGFIDKEDEKEYDFSIDLNEIEVNFPEPNIHEEDTPPGLITTGEGDDKIGIALRYPPAELFDEQLAASKSEDAEWFVASKCIDKIFEADDVHLADDYTTEELVDFIKNLDTKTYDKIKKFIGSTPHLSYTIKYTNSKGTEREIALTTLTDFFTL